MPSKVSIDNVKSVAKGIGVVSSPSISKTLILNSCSKYKPSGSVALKVNCRFWSFS